MQKKKVLYIVMTLVLLFSFVAACAPPAVEEPAAEAPAAEEPAAEEPAAEEMMEPTELRAVAFSSSSIEEPWNSVFVAAWDRVAATSPHGLTMTLDFAEEVAVSDFSRVVNEYFSTGEYDVIISHNGEYKDATEDFMAANPDVLVVANGSVFEARGGNFFHSNVYIQECAYLTGIIAGMMTETNKVGAVASFPYPNVNLPLNAFFLGAKSVNPDVEQVITYIENWWDPPKAAESAAAQIAAGADLIYAERFGPFEAVKDAGVLAFGHFSDQHELAPDVVITSTEARWDPSVEAWVDLWWENAANGVAFDAPTETYLPTMAEGVCDISPYYDMEDIVPQDVKDAVEQAKQDIMSGALEVPYVEDQVVSD
jgi:basic membrane protein A and related proteins